MDNCPICERIEDVKRTGRIYKSITFKIALIEDSNRNGVFSGRLTHRATRFQYCPICGKKYSKSSLYVKVDRKKGAVKNECKTESKILQTQV